MDVLDAINGRVSPGRLAEPAPDDMQLQRILLAGARAPDHGLLAPWRFVVIAGGARQTLAEALAAMARRADPTLSDEALDKARAKAFRAPMILVVVARIVEHRKVPPIEQQYAVAACAQTIILAANALGFAATWKTGPAAYDPGVKSALGLDAADAIVAFLYIGTAVAMPAPRPASIEGKLRWL